MFDNKGLFFLCALFFLVLCIASPLRAESGATTTVKAVLDKAMDIQTQPNIQGTEHRKERADQTRKLIAENFHSAEMARESLQDQWDKLAPAQRHQYQELFTGLFQDSYTRMVLNFLKRETVEYRGESPQGKQVKVQTVIMRTNEHIPVDYILEQKGQKWLILDVFIDGVSIVDTYKNSLGKYIRTKGYDSLIQRMRIQKKAGEES
jgi:phospholipid transport system substrate-binding protein